MFSYLKLLNLGIRFLMSFSIKTCDIFQKMFIGQVILVSGVYSVDIHDLADGFLIPLIFSEILETGSWASVWELRSISDGTVLF